jgi:hypothetical protein
MKITKSKLRQIIREELDKSFGAEKGSPIAKACSDLQFQYDKILDDAIADIQDMQDPRGHGGYIGDDFHVNIETKLNQILKDAGRGCPIKLRGPGDDGYDVLRLGFGYPKKDGKEHPDWLLPPS